MGPRPEDIRRPASLAGTAFENYAGELHRFLLRRLRRPQDAEDLAQEVFMRLSRIDDGEFVENPRAYLFGIASHVVFEFRMRGRLKEWLVFDSDAAEAAAEQPSQSARDELAERLSLQQQLTAALGRLPPLQLAVFLLHKRDGYSYEEIAGRLGLSVRRIESHIAQARSLLRKMHWDR